MTCGQAPFSCGYVDKFHTSRKPLTCGGAVYSAIPVDTELGVEAPAFDNFHMPKDTS